MKKQLLFKLIFAPEVYIIEVQHACQHSRRELYP